MNDRNLDTVVHAALERQALSAPNPQGLLEKVKRRSRRRRIRQLVVAAGTVAVLGTAAAVTTVSYQGAPSPAAQQLGTGDIAVCVGLSGEQVRELTVTERAWGDTIDTETVEVTQGPAFLEYTAIGADDAVKVELLSGRLADRAPTGSRESTVAGRAALLGQSPDGTPVLVFASGIGDLVIRLTAIDPGPDGALLAEWASQFSIHSDPAACLP